VTKREKRKKRNGVFFLVFCLRNRKSKQASKQGRADIHDEECKWFTGNPACFFVFYFLEIEQTISLRRTSNPFTHKDRAEKVGVRRCNRTEQRKAEEVKRNPSHRSSK